MPIFAKVPEPEREGESPLLFALFFFIILLACSQSAHLLGPRNPSPPALPVQGLTELCTLKTIAQSIAICCCFSVFFCFGHFYLTFFIKHEMKMPFLPYTYFFFLFFRIFAVFYLVFFFFGFALTSHFSYSSSPTQKTFRLQKLGIKV